MSRSATLTTIPSVSSPSAIQRRALPATVVICAMLAMAGCGSPLAGDPVATVTVQLDRDTIPLGAPARLSFQFVVPPSHETLTEDYRVMVHFLDTNGEMMWAADHDPPTPTSQWQPGQTVSYTERVRIPMYPYIGEAVVAVGLYSATTGQRLTLDGEDLGQRAYRGTTVALEPQPESSFLMYQDGWHDDEFNRDTGERWRWTSERASLSFRNPGADATLYLELDGRVDLFDPPQLVSLRVGDIVVYETRMETPGHQFHEVELDAGQLGAEETVTLLVEVDRTFVPSAVDGGQAGDQRELGIRVFYAFLEPHS